jgi:TldD protein
MMLQYPQLDLKSYLRTWSGGGYIDLRYHKETSWQISLREESFEESSESLEFVTCRVAQGGYGVASSSKIDSENIRSVMLKAQKLARLQAKPVTLAPVSVEVGYKRHPPSETFDESEAAAFLKDLSARLRERLGSLYARSELIASHAEVHSSLVTSEGAEVCEEWSFTDLVIYLAVRWFRVGYASCVVGGLGGLEVLKHRDLEILVDKLARRAANQLQAALLPPLERGKHFKVVLDCEAAGALAHEVAHLLEGGGWAKKLVGLDLAGDVTVVDDPTLPSGYGSFTWDSEGVRGRRKILLSREEVNALHTRLTASDGREAGNARGERAMPTPIMSNVYFKSSDWRVDEMIQDMRSGIYVEGVVRCDVDLSDGTFELVPEIAYMVENKELKTPLKQIRLRGNIVTILKRIDAVGRVIQLRPNLEKGCRVSEGGPHLRVNGLQCG